MLQLWNSDEDEMLWMCDRYDDPLVIIGFLFSVRVFLKWVFIHYNLHERQRVCVCVYELSGHVKPGDIRV